MAKSNSNPSAEGAKWLDGFCVSQLFCCVQPFLKNAATVRVASLVKGKRHGEAGAD
jgi:hypothetical protein